MDIRSEDLLVECVQGGREALRQKDNAAGKLHNGVLETRAGLSQSQLGLCESTPHNMSISYGSVSTKTGGQQTFPSGKPV